MRGIRQLGTEHLTRRSGPGHPAHNDVMEATAGLAETIARMFPGDNHG